MWRSACGCSGKERRDPGTVERMLPLVNLAGLKNGKWIPFRAAAAAGRHRPALANNPSVLLLDEPLAALDLKLRKDMQVELKNIQKSLGITFVYVTHDQEEALSMSDTVVVMDNGVIQQIGSPQDIYNEPENAFVADFIGESNILDGIMHEDRLVEFFGRKFRCVDTGFERMGAGGRGDPARGCGHRPARPGPSDRHGDERHLQGCPF